MGFGDIFAGQKDIVLNVTSEFDKAAAKQTVDEVKKMVANIKSVGQITKISKKDTEALSAAFGDLKAGTRAFESMVADVNRLEFLEKAQKSLKEHGIRLTDAKGDLKDYGAVTKEMMLLKKKDTAGYNALVRNIHAMELGIEDNTNAFHRFKGELMSVMFFGMQLAAVFGGMLEPAKKLAGTTTILSAILGLMFLPEMLKVNDALFDFWTFIEKHPEMEGFIKSVIILGYVLGIVLFSIGWIGLGTTGLKDFKVQIGLLIPKVMAFAATMKTAFVGSMLSVIMWARTFAMASMAVKFSMLTALLPMIAIIILVVWALRIMYRHWDYFGAKFSAIIHGAWDVIVGFANIVIGIFQTIGGFIAGFITGDFTMFHNGIARIVDGIGGIVGGLIDIFWNAAAIIGGILGGMILDVADAINWIARQLGKGDLIDVTAYRIKGYGSAGKERFNLPSVADNILPETGGVDSMTVPNIPIGSYENTNNITINNPMIRNEYDIDAIAKKIAEIQNMNITGIGGMP